MGNSKLTAAALLLTMATAGMADNERSGGGYFSKTRDKKKDKKTLHRRARNRIARRSRKANR